MRIRRRRRYQAIEPDEILIDAANLPQFDTGRLEGRIERPLAARAFSGFLLIAALIGTGFLLQLGKLQVVEADSLKERAEANRLDEQVIIAERGFITDRHGVPLALNEPQESLGYSLRAYPLKDAAAHIVGYVSYPRRDSNGFWYETSVKGVVGIERFREDELVGKNGVEIRETNALGELVSGSVVRAPREGDEIALSLDAGVQEVLFDSIRRRTNEALFEGGSAVIIDIHTGEVVALASYPSFNPETLSLGEDREAIASYVSDKRAPFLDRAVSGLYTPGSVVKPFMAIAALEENIISPEKAIYSSGSISIPNPYNPSLPSVFRDWRAHGWTDMREAIAVSSDVYFYAIGGGYEEQRGLGISNIEKYMRLFGFGEITHITVSGEEAGTIPSPEWKARTFDGEQWFLGNTYHTSIGQYGFQVTPIQLARAVAALGNGGFLVEPKLERGAPPTRQKIPVSEASLKVAREGMRLAVTEGTATALFFDGVSAAAKTGTAEVGARKEFINSLIVGFFPYEEPRYAFAVVMERAKAGTTAGSPIVAREVLEWIRDNRPEMLEVE